MELSSVVHDCFQILRKGLESSVRQCFLKIHTGLNVSMYLLSQGLSIKVLASASKLKGLWKSLARYHTAHWQTRDYSLRSVTAFSTIMATLDLRSWVSNDWTVANECCSSNSHLASSISFVIYCCFARRCISKTGHHGPREKFCHHQPRHSRTRYGLTCLECLIRNPPESKLVAEISIRLQRNGRWPWRDKFSFSRRRFRSPRAHCVALEDRTTKTSDGNTFQPGLAAASHPAALRLDQAGETTDCDQCSAYNSTVRGGSHLGTSIWRVRHWLHKAAMIDEVYFDWADIHWLQWCRTNDKISRRICECSKSPVLLAAWHAILVVERDICTILNMELPKPEV